MHLLWLAVFLWIGWSLLGQAYSEATEDRIQINFVRTDPAFDIVEVRYLWPKNFAEYRLVFDAPALDPRQHQTIVRYNRKTREFDMRPPATDQGKPLFGEPRNEILVMRDLVRPKGAARPEVVSITTRLSFPKGTDLRAKAALIEVRKTPSRNSPAHLVWSSAGWSRAN